MSTPALGFGLPVSGSWATPQTMVWFAREAEAAGYESLWAFQRLLHPVDGAWGPMYRSVHDPLVSLAHVAAVTERVRLGVAILNMPYYAPVVLAKQLSTLDAVSAGRLDVGLGLGWAPEEFTAVGMPYERRGARGEEFLACLKTIWADDPVQFDGEFYTVPASYIDPKPVQRPHPPLLLGGSAERALRRVGRLADGWVSASRHDLSRIGEAITVIKDAAAEAGRDVDALRFVVRGTVLLDEELRGRDGGRRLLTGAAGLIRKDLVRLGEEGVTQVFLDANFDPAIGSPDADPTASTERARRLLETFAPAAL